MLFQCEILTGFSMLGAYGGRVAAGIHEQWRGHRHLAGDEIITVQPSSV